MEREVVEVVKTVEVYIDQKSDSLIDLSKVEGIVNPKNFSWPREIQAMNGNIVINQEPQRILTVSLGHDEMLFGFVELDKIVATTSFSQDPGGNIFEFSNGLPVITADPEVIIAQDPDIVFADPYANFGFKLMNEENGKIEKNNKLKNKPDDNILIFNKYKKN